MVKATENNNYTNPDYAAAKVRAASAGAYFCAYHFLHAGNGAGQASYAYGRVGSGIPLMIDCEPTYNSNGTIASAPQISDAVDFINEYRALGGTVYLLYLPHWYWQGNLGQVSLIPGRRPRHAARLFRLHRLQRHRTWLGRLRRNDPSHLAVHLDRLAERSQ